VTGKRIAQMARMRVSTAGTQPFVQGACSPALGQEDVFQKHQFVMGNRIMGTIMMRIAARSLRVVLYSFTVGMIVV